MSSSLDMFEELQREGKRLAAEGRLHESLHKFELARKIKETSKILNRIQKLKDAIGENEKEKPARKREKLFIQKSSGSIDKSEKLSGVLSQIQNVEVQAANPADLSPERLKSFNELKSKAIDFSYEGKFDEALRCFSEARKLCDCPKVKKYIQELEALVSKYPKKLEEFQNLTDTGKKLASAGKPAESLEKLKDAFAVCPSPAVSRMIKKMQAKSPSVEAPAFSPSEFKEHVPNKNCDKDAEVLANRTVSASSESKENHFNYSHAKNNGSNGSEVSLPSGSEATSVNPADLSPEAKGRFKHLYSQAKKHAAAGRLQESLDTMEEVRRICPAEKILKGIKDLKEHIKQVSLEYSSDMIEVGDGFFVFHEIYNKLYPYQREGVRWMWKLFKMKKGGVLGDDMGLGKTFQVIAFLSGLIDAELIKYALIIMPVSLLPNWKKEFKKWCPGISVSVYHGGSKNERERNLLRVQRRGHVLLTSYGMVLNAIASLTDFEGRSFVWDYVILDEGHKIKNPTKTTKAVHAIPSKNRLVLTGTPVQNNLLELWALYDFVHQGTLLGSLKTFKMQYENTITRAREKDSTAGEKRLGTEMAENLKMLIKPYFLRRTKAEIWAKKPEISEGTGDLDKEMEQLRISENKLSSRKNDLIVWTFMSEAQCEIYRSFLHSEAVKTILVSKRSPLVELTTLKKICDHPRLLSQRACAQLGLNGDLDEEDLQRELNDESNYSSSIEKVSDETLMTESGKMKFLIQLLENLRNEGHRTLVFSLSRKILDMIYRILINRQWKVLRIDGTISKIEERERRIQLFQKDPSYTVFLLTTQVGGVGITLTAADRVVIYDPSWNPATDAQAVDRVYRIGQKKNVVVYRLITCGTVEEKIYRRQIFKNSITNQATGSSDPYRYFSKQELRELFTFENPRHSATQVQLSQLHSHQRLSDTQLDAHIAFLYSLDIFGISDHDLMFSREIEDDTEDNEPSAISHDYIKKQVAAAQVLIQTEASVVAEGIRLAGTFSRPFSERIPVSKNSKPVAQMFKATSSPSTDSKPKPPFRISPNYMQISHPSGNDLKNVVSDASAPLSGKRSVDRRSNISKHASPTGSDRDKNMSRKDSIHETNEHVSIIELSSDDEERNHLTSQISPIASQSVDRFAHDKIKNASDVIPDASTPLLSQRIANRCSYISNYVSPTESDISHKDSIHGFETDHYDLDVKNVSVELNSDDEERNHQTPQVSLSNTMISHDESAGDFVLKETNASTPPPIENRRSDISKYASPTESDREDSIHGADLDIKNASVELNSDGEETSQIPPSATIISRQSVGDFALNASTPSLLEQNGVDRCSDISKHSPAESDRETNVSPHYSESHIDCFHEDLDMEDVSVIEANNSSPSTERNVSLRNVEQITSAESNSDIRSMCENEGTDTEDVPELGESSAPTDSSSRRKPETSISNDNSSNQLSHKDSKCSLQKNTEASYIQSPDLNSTSCSARFHLARETSGVISNETTPSESRCSSIGLGEASPMALSMADLSFDDKPCIPKRKSCALPTIFVASDSDSSCPPSPSKSDNFVASTDSEEEMNESNASSCIVPSSIPNSPAPRDKTFYNRTNGHLSPRRITPLKVRKSFCLPPDRAFAQALASSPIIQLPCDSSDSETDSPVKVCRTAGKRKVIESSDED